MKYDCPIYRVGCVVNHRQALAIIKGHWDDALPDESTSHCGCRTCCQDSASSNLSLRCSNGHSICLTRGRKLAGWSCASPTHVKFDCPKAGCGVGCVLEVTHMMALMKCTWDWQLPNGQEGTRTNIDVSGAQV
eukprot:TRINITY_DN82402_c0_g1_i1.p1 TRINITY_DN82402_c0_g1~~TRINITY_DN82402_c0_g1_i1.p1  ORF type:complete len:133 (+),score=9.97 TRINITY_DN82402_c0_g1_i1:194-592(+)